MQHRKLANFRCIISRRIQQKISRVKKIEYCCHCKATESLNPREIFDIDGQIAPFHFMPDMTDIQVLTRGYISLVTTC